jgi:polar amino acid transport system substrate-binding protein
MSSPCNKRISKGLISAWILGAVLTHRAEAGGVLNVCVDEANPTAAMDLRIARAVAKTQGYSVKPVTFEGVGRGGDGLPPSRFAKLAQSDCQLIMGFPVDVGNPNLPPNVAATSAYASTGFVLIRRGGGSANMSLSALPNGSEVGIAALDTYAGLLFGTHPNIVMHVYPKDSLMLADLQAKHIAAGVAWQPSIESYENTHPQHASLRVAVLPGEHMLWNLVALYVPQSQDAGNLFNKGLYELQSKGQLEPLTKPYGQAAATGAVRTSARLPAARLQHAVAWDTDSGGLMTVADTGTSAGSKHLKVPALYTDDQATKGALAYYQNCAMCHGPLLEGQLGGFSGPALKGPEFADPSYHFHLSDIFNFVAKLMPAATPGSLTHEQDVQIMAFILQQNGYPSGSKELVYESAEKSKIPIKYYGK